MSTDTNRPAIGPSDADRGGRRHRRQPEQLPQRQHELLPGGHRIRLDQPLTGLVIGWRPDRGLGGVLSAAVIIGICVPVSNALLRRRTTD